MIDEIFIKQMSPIDAYNYGRQMMEKELNEIHLCECKQIRADAIDEMLSKIHTTWLFRGNDAKAYREEIDYIAERLKEQSNGK